MDERKRLLIIDDDPFIRKSLSDIFALKGYDAIASGSGQEGLYIMEGGRVDVVLIDLMLPDMPGLSVLDRMKAEGMETEAIILTGHAGVETAMEAINKGAFAYLKKPCAAAELLVLVRRAIEKQDAEEKIRKYREHLEELVRERTAELETARDLALAGSRTKTDFISNMSHEIRTPLNAIIGFSDVLLDGCYGELSKTQKEYVRMIREGGRRLEELMLNVLDYADSESGRMELMPVMFRVREMIGAVVSRSGEDPAFRRIELGISIAPDADIEIEADRRKLEQVMFNLLSNAVKFTPEGGIVSIRARRVRGGRPPEGLPLTEVEPAPHPGTQGPGAVDDLIEISVEDSGIGIREEDMHRLYDAFSQLERPLTKRYRGGGLGLAVSKVIVELHGGRIWAESEYGKGSRFRFTVPLRRGADLRARPAGLSSGQSQEALEQGEIR